MGSQPNTSDTMSNTSELACVYAALILADDEIDITGDKISTILKAAKLTTVEPFWPGLFAKALGACDVKALITTIGSGVGSGPAAGGAVPAAAEEKKEEKKEEPAEESDDDMG